MSEQKQQYFCKNDYLSHCAPVNVSFILNVNFNKDRKHKRKIQMLVQNYNFHCIVFRTFILFREKIKCKHSNNICNQT